jgi:hypothetical protein
VRMEHSDSSDSGTWENTQAGNILHKYYDSDLVHANNSYEWIISIIILFLNMCMIACYTYAGILNFVLVLIHNFFNKLLIEFNWFKWSHILRFYELLIRQN